MLQAWEQLQAQRQQQGNAVGGAGGEALLGGSPGLPAWDVPPLLLSELLWALSVTAAGRQAASGGGEERQAGAGGGAMEQVMRALGDELAGALPSLPIHARARLAESVIAAGEATAAGGLRLTEALTADAQRLIRRCRRRAKLTTKVAGKEEEEEEEEEETAEEVSVAGEGSQPVGAGGEEEGFEGTGEDGGISRLSRSELAGEETVQERADESLQDFFLEEQKPQHGGPPPRQGSPRGPPWRAEQEAMAYVSSVASLYVSRSGWDYMFLLDLARHCLMRASTTTTTSPPGVMEGDQQWVQAGPRKRPRDITVPLAGGELTRLAHALSLVLVGQFSTEGMTDPGQHQAAGSDLDAGTLAAVNLRKGVKKLTVTAAAALAESAPGLGGVLASCSDIPDLEVAVAAFLLSRDAMAQGLTPKMPPNLREKWQVAIDACDRAAKAASARLQGLVQGRAGYRKTSSYAKLGF